jgi:hypothetical protein
VIHLDHFRMMSAIREELEQPLDELVKSKDRERIRELETALVVLFTAVLTTPATRDWTMARDTAHAMRLAKQVIERG